VLGNGFELDTKTHVTIFIDNTGITTSKITQLFLRALIQTMPGLHLINR
jgi:antitoxin component of RelBE/YafQ-DinJ toxin-antitoxin module